jgi:nucleotide-binding universal stress UspA family protein
MNDSVAEAPALFRRIVCGVDGTPESTAAVEQAARLKDEGGELRLVSAANLALAAHAGGAAVHAADLLQQEAESALAEARRLAPSATEHLVNGDPVAVLLREAEQANLLALGTHGRGRKVAHLLGTVAARMIRDASTSILIARPARESEWPQSIVAGVDGSAESGLAFSVARLVAERFGATVRAAASTKDHLDAQAAREIAPDLEEDARGAVEALVEASDSADLLVVGSRGLHGLKALGSVSERVANQARCSVIVVRSQQVSTAT